MGKQRRSRKAVVKRGDLLAVSDGRIDGLILLLRGERVLLDSDLAELYGVSTGRLNEAVRRNAGRFPPDFMFRLSEDEFGNLKSQIAISSSGWGGRRKLPCAFTEHGAIQAANVLNSPRAVQAGVFVVRAFVRLRRMLAQNKDLAAKLEELERKLEGHDEQITTLFDAIHELMAPPPDPPRSKIGFDAEAKSPRGPYGKRQVSGRGIPAPKGLPS